MTATSTQQGELPKVYAPGEVEARTYEWWERSGFFLPLDDPNAPVFSVTIPPPNVTGELHLGHALTYSIEDVLGRYKRMREFSTVILPGMDHASIAVHAKIEAALATEGIMRRSDIGRDEFMRRAWEWKASYGAAINHQFRALGEGYDWSRERFTMDPAYCRAVATMFVRLYDEGYIYRGSRVINWCAGCRTGISDIEVRPEEREGRLYFVRLPFTNGSGEIVVATVRPETMFGDVAVAVHPEDQRYVAAVGKTVRHPLTGGSIPIIADEFVDPQFGTGAVKITPAHDYADFEVGERHHLPMPVVITPQAKMSESLPEPFPGRSVDDARKLAVEQLERDGYLVRSVPHVHNVPLCDRCGTVIEPLLSEQWFMRMNELAAPAIEAVKSGRVRFVPDRWAKVYLDWMEHIRPWNISRQLWWGHRIPIYYCSNGHVSASIEPPTSCQECRSNDFTQDPDILDTWFSSAIWPFATFGWPDETPDLARFYPTSFMNTSSQILYLWIARMIMMGIHFMGDIPFPVVLINPTILNEKGQRMSKSLGTGIDPLDTVDRYGADATRFGVFSAGSSVQQEIRIAGYERAEDGQRFANKIWNAARFVLANIEPSVELDSGKGELDLRLPEKWILNRVNAAERAVTEAMEKLDLTAGLRTVYDFFWSEFADWYVEMAKLTLRGDDEPAKAAVRIVLWSVLDRSMRLLHPFMPFITEEVWQRLGRQVPPGALNMSALPKELPESIMIAPWHDGSAPEFEQVDETMGVLTEVVGAIRNLRAEHNVKPKQRLSAEVITDEWQAVLESEGWVIEGLAGLGQLVVMSSSSAKRADVAEMVVNGVTIRVSLAELTNIKEERARLERELVRLRAEADRVRALVENPNFASKAPAHVVTAEREKLARLNQSIEQLQAHDVALARAVQ